uniref:TY3B-I_1 protein n=1 Tax=Fopius arisanus TaxID=64838 RepID=A0A0C9RT30_9HYME
MIPFGNQRINDYPTAQPFSGGQLSVFVQRWEELGAPQSVLKIISASRIPLCSKPTLTPNWHSSPFKTKVSSAMSNQIQLLLSQNVLERPHNPGPSFISRMFLITKNNGEFRPIFDLRGLNQHVRTKKFKLISHHKIPDFLQDGDWLVRIDLSNAYYHIPVVRNHRSLLRLSYNGELYQMTSLPFGLSSAPHTFAMVSNWVAETLRAQGVRVVVYLDDFLLASQNRATAHSQAIQAMKRLEFLGWHVNLNKCILEPCQELDFLGLTWNTVENRMSLPVKKARKIHLLSEELKSSGVCRLKQLQTLLGHLNFADYVIPRGRLHSRYLQIFLTNFNQRRPRQKLHIPTTAKSELKWWSEAVHLNSPLHKPPVQFFLTTDAADSGWGAQLGSHHMAGTWTNEQRDWHSNKKEMFAALSALREVVPQIQGSHVMLQTDNRSLAHNTTQ